MPARPPDLSPAGARLRKRWRAWRVGLPTGLAALGLAAVSVAWAVERGRVVAALADAPDRARAAGVQLSLGAARVGGFPFRLRVAVGRVRIALRSGWRVEAPALVAQAYVHAPLHWVLVAPEGFTLVRPEGGPVRIVGRALRASVAGVDASPWRVTLAGDDVDFATPPGARPFSLRSAVRIGLYLRPAPAGAPGAAPGDGAVLLDLARARATPGSLAWNLAPDAPIDAAVEGRLTGLAAFHGRDWAAAVRAWRGAGGRLVLGRAEAQGGPTELWARGGAVGVDADGRLSGAVPLRLRQAPRLFAGPAGAQTVAVRPLDPATREATGVRLDLRLGGGEVRLGPVRVGPAPRVG